MSGEWEHVVDTDDSGRTVSFLVEIIARIPFAIEDAAWSMPSATIRARPADKAGAHYDPEKPTGRSVKYPNLGVTIAPHFYAEIVITKHAMRPYVRFGTEGFYKRLDGEGPLRLELIGLARTKG